MRGRSLLGIVVGVLAAGAAGCGGCGDDDLGLDFPDAGSYNFDAGTMDGGPATPGGRRMAGRSVAEAGWA